MKFVSMHFTYKRNIEIILYNLIHITIYPLVIKYPFLYSFKLSSIQCGQVTHLKSNHLIKG